MQQEALDIDGLKRLVVPLHVHCGELTLSDLRQRNPKRQRIGSLTLRVPPPAMFQYTLKALGLERHIVNRLDFRFIVLFDKALCNLVLSVIGVGVFLIVTPIIIRRISASLKTLF